MTDLLLCLSGYPRDLVEGWVSELDVRVVLVDDDDAGTRWRDFLPEARLVIGDAARRHALDAAAIGQLGQCARIIQPSVGVDGVVDVRAAQDAGIEVRNAPGYNAEAVADWAVMGMLVGLRDAAQHDQEMRRSGWHRPPLGRELGAMTVGIVGYGSIGRAVRRRLAGFGSNVLVHSRQMHDDTVTSVGLDELLSRSDVVTLHLPLTTATEGLLDGRRLGLMKPRSVLVNTSRGGLIDEAALCSALQLRRPEFAVLDVFQDEPLADSNPLRELPNTLLSPHVAAGTEQARQRVRELVGQLTRETFQHST